MIVTKEIIKQGSIYFILIFLSSIKVIPAYAQLAKKPTIMILPSDNWCSQRFFMDSYFNQGTKVDVPNYQLAFMEDIELCQVISKVGGILTDLGYSLKDAEQAIKSLNIKSAENDVTESKSSGAYLQETSLDMLKRRLKSDILIQIWWNLNKKSEGHYISFTLEAFDTYTNKRIATSSGTTKVSKGIIPRLLEQVIKKNIRTFVKQMDTWYEDQQANGREISMTVRCWDNWENDLETIYNNTELLESIQEWLYKNTVHHAFNLTDGTETFAQFEQVRIPLFDKGGKAIDARSFVTGLQKFLQDSPYNITSKIILRGLGECIIILGEK